MRKPVPWKEPSRLTVEAPSTRKQKQANPAGVGNGVGAAPRSKPRRSPASATHTVAPTVKPRKATASLPLLMLLGHSESCAELRRAGGITACDCRIKPMEDPAVTVGLVIHYARISLAQRVPIPTVIIELLTRRIEEGDPACIMVAEWCDASGLLNLKPLTRSKRRPG
ncbi:hypothetical protein ACVILI_004244 [Mesorhizobium sp. USDA 4775]